VPNQPCSSQATDSRRAFRRNQSAIAKREGATQRYVAHLIKLAFLAPDIMTAIIRGKAPANVSLDRLKKGFPLDWVEQRKALGFPPRSPR
jgi:site-specific DNA recombinase